MEVTFVGVESWNLERKDGRGWNNYDKYMLYKNLPSFTCLSKIYLFNAMAWHVMPTIFAEEWVWSHFQQCPPRREQSSPAMYVPMYTVVERIMGNKSKNDRRPPVYHGNLFGIFPIIMFAQLNKGQCVAFTLWRSKVTWGTLVCWDRG